MCTCSISGTERKLAFAGTLSYFHVLYDTLRDDGVVQHRSLLPIFSERVFVEVFDEVVLMIVEVA